MFWSYKNFTEIFNCKNYELYHANRKANHLLPLLLELAHVIPIMNPLSWIMIYAMITYHDNVVQ